MNNEKKQKILIVDDDSFVRGAYVAVFKQANFEVIEAVDGLDALKKVSESLPDIIFTGIIMPNLGGFGLTEKLKSDEKYKDIPIVVSSHRGKEEDRQWALVLGIKDFIVSGFVSPAEVVERIKKILNKRKTYVLNIDNQSPDLEKLKIDYPNLFVGDKNQFIRLLPKEDGQGFDVEVH